MGEVWNEVITELNTEQLRPVTPDMEAIEAISRAIEERVHIVAGTQHELLEAQNNQDALDEQEFYSEVQFFVLHFFITLLSSQNKVKINFKNVL